VGGGWSRDWVDGYIAGGLYIYMVSARLERIEMGRDKFRMLKMYSFLFVERRENVLQCIAGKYLTRIFRLPSRCEHACYTLNAK
jgi:hypothetical protein